MDIYKQKLYRIYNGICHLGEGPLWNFLDQKLYWTDIFNKQIWVYDPIIKECKIFWQGDLMVGGFAFTKKGGIVLCTDKGVYIIRNYVKGISDNQVELLYSIPFSHSEMFNDITVDPMGRIFAGTLDRTCPKGVLFLFEKGKKPMVLLENIGCSNGMTFSLDQRFFFHTDSLSRRITRYDYNIQTGHISNPEVFFQAEENQGSPDGITLDSEGFIWVAFWNSSAVRRINPKGKIVGEIIIPAIQPSSVMFGGKDLKDLYITSACEGAINLKTGYDDKGNFLGGPVYLCHMQVRGRAEWLADF